VEKKEHCGYQIGEVARLGEEGRKTEARGRGKENCSCRYMYIC